MISRWNSIKSVSKGELLVRFAVGSVLQSHFFNRQFPSSKDFHSYVFSIRVCLYISFVLFYLCRHPSTNGVTGRLVCTFFFVKLVEILLCYRFWRVPDERKPQWLIGWVRNFFSYIIHPPFLCPCPHRETFEKKQVERRNVVIVELLCERTNASTIFTFIPFMLHWELFI